MRNVLGCSVLGADKMIALNNSLSQAVAAGKYVPYTGAIQDVNLGAHFLSADGFNMPFNEPGFPMGAFNFEDIPSGARAAFGVSTGVGIYTNPVAFLFSSLLDPSLGSPGYNPYVIDMVTGLFTNFGGLDVRGRSAFGAGALDVGNAYGIPITMLTATTFTGTFGAEAVPFFAGYNGPGYEGNPLGLAIAIWPDLNTVAMGATNIGLNVNNLVFNAEGGNLGVGTMTPTYPLDVNGATNIYGPLTVGQNTKLNLDADGQIVFQSGATLKNDDLGTGLDCIIPIGALYVQSGEAVGTPGNIFFYVSDGAGNAATFQFDGQNSQTSMGDTQGNSMAIGAVENFWYTNTTDLYMTSENSIYFSSYYNLGFKNILGTSIMNIVTEYGGTLQNCVGIWTIDPNSRLQVNGSFAKALVSKTANYTATIDDATILCTANSFTVTLPTAVGVTGRIYDVKNIGTGSITIATTSSQKIDALSTITLSQWENATLQSTGTNWILL
jgi:hypothetical protein